MDAVTQSQLQALFRREGRSLLHYVNEVFPWSRNGGERLTRLRALVDQEQAWLSELARYLQRNRITPALLDAYPVEFTSLNFLGLDHVLHLLIAAYRDALVQIEQDLAQLHDPAARQLVEKLLAMKRDHLRTLEELAALPQPATTR